MRYGYVRVSSKDQCIDRQVAALKKVIIPSENIFIDRASGQNFARKNYLRMLRHLQTDDEVFIKSIDRLGRNYDEIIIQWHKITREKAAHIVVLECPLLDTRQQVNGLTGKFMADLVLQILSYVAQVERDNIKQRQKEGIYEAKKRGVIFGRPRLLIPEEFEEIARSWRRGEISLRAGADQLAVSHSTFAKWLNLKNVKKE